MNIANKIRIYLPAIFIIFFVQTHAQSALTNAFTFWQNKQLVPAKETIDEYLAGEGEGKATAWLLKSRIYADLGADQRYRNLTADPELEAFEALLRAISIDKAGITAKLKHDYTMVMLLYKSVTGRGISLYNAGLANAAPQSFAAALEQFRQALRISNLMHQEGWGMPALDTNLLYSSCQAAIHAQSDDQVILYGRKLTDAQVYQTSAHKKSDFLNIYSHLVRYYQLKQESTLAIKQAVAAVKIYPGEQFFYDVLIDLYRKQADFSLLLQVEERAFQQFPGQQRLHINYCKDLFGYLYTNKMIKTRQATEAKLEQLLQQYAVQYPPANDGRLLLAKHFYNKATHQQKAGYSAATIRESLTSAVVILVQMLGSGKELSEKERQTVLTHLCRGMEALGRKAEADHYRKQLSIN